MTIYLDANADAPILPRAWDAYAEACAEFADPEALHPAGQRAAERLAAARQEVARALGAEADELVFTSGGTEADALALQGLVRDGGHLVTTTIEHPAIAKTVDTLAARRGITVTRVAPGRDGRVAASAVAAALRPETCLVSIVYACNETGVVQPVEEVAELCRHHAVLVHTDAVQATGRLPFDCHALGVDALSFAGHKLGAVGGVGGLYMRRGVHLAPLFGTSPANLPGVVSLAAALEGRPSAIEQAKTAMRRDQLEDLLHAQVDDLEVIGAAVPRLCNTSCVRFPGFEADGLLMALDIEGVHVSTGSACSSGAIEPSPILLGMGLSRKEARETLRYSLHRNTSDGDIERAVAATLKVLGRGKQGAHAI